MFLLQGKRSHIQQYDAKPVAIADVLLSQMAQSIPVDVMAGPTDPCTVALPQQPIHRGLFPNAKRFASFNTVTNPYQCDLSLSSGTIRLLGTSGQPMDDIFRFVEEGSRKRIAEQLLKWGNISPTAPDTLSCYPYKDTDPFVMSPSRPHIYFMGNQPEFESDLVQEKRPDGSTDTTRIVLVPNFAQTGTLVLVNLRTLDVIPVSFKADL